MPSATSAKAARSSLDPRLGPCSNSLASMLTVQWPRCTALATTARTSRKLPSSRAASATARGAATNRISPTTHTTSGIRRVCWTWTNELLPLRTFAGTRTSTISGDAAVILWRRSAA